MIDNLRQQIESIKKKTENAQAWLKLVGQIIVPGLKVAVSENQLSDLEQRQANILNLLVIWGKSAIDIGASKIEESDFVISTLAQKETIEGVAYTGTHFVSRAVLEIKAFLGGDNSRMSILNVIKVGRLTETDSPSALIIQREDALSHKLLLVPNTSHPLSGQDWSKSDPKNIDPYRRAWSIDFLYNLGAAFYEADVDYNQMQEFNTN